ncbi:hypothetical protein SLE2022_358510 [Rubroshorea leprosula]
MVQVYIVYLGLSQSQDPIFTSKSHLQLLTNVFSSKEEAKHSLLYSYKHSFSGFSAKLNSSQAATLANMEEVVSVFQSRTLKLHTTRSWDFLGLTLYNAEDVVSPVQLAYGDDVVVGIFDTGVWPESKSFREEPEMGPIPSRWKGACIAGEKFDPAKACNRKLIGARYYIKGFEQTFGPLNTSGNPEYRSARDFLGHGTHTASTAVGSIVKNASFFGIGQGTARGGAPRARLAVYKTCWGKNLDGMCTEEDILAAFDDALSDGVNVISASFGSTPPLAPFFASSADIGSFHAAQNGVSVVFSAGNDGPDPSLVNNVAPWSLCVAASSIDRTFPAEIVLDGNVSITGEGIITEEIKGRVVKANIYFANGICESGYWNQKPAVGRVILCFSTSGQLPVEIAQAAVKTAKGLGLIFAEPLTKQTADVDIAIIPTVYVDIAQGTRIWNYITESPKFPIVQIAPSKTIIRRSPAPAVAYFSSRGPSTTSPDVLKPDVTAPGISILAAWPPATPPTLLPKDTRSVSWNFQSGTSMSCPHVSGAVALIKSVHPNWSPAAIRSALMTTSYTKDTTLDTILSGGSTKGSDPFDIGAGHINPLKALDPGLVYDTKPSDYILFLCNIGYTQQQIKRITGTNVSCPHGHRSNANINYPSITVSNLQSSTTIKRTVRNVGCKKNAVYFATVVEPNGVEILIWPSILIFSSFKDEISYYVTLNPVKKSQGRYDFGEIVWSDGLHNVRSPLVVFVNKTFGVPSYFNNSYKSI